MGGYGSGARYRSKETTSCYRQLDVRRWQRDGLLRAGQSFAWQWIRNNQAIASICVRTEPGRVVLSYRHRTNEREQWQLANYPVHLSWTPCNFGGSRAWFTCPSCARRVAILYDSSTFVCRHCLDLVYNSQRQSAFDRTLRRAQAIRIKLGGSGNLIQPFPWKPKRMHWRTYERICNEAARQEQVFTEFAMRDIERLRRRVGLVSNQRRRELHQDHR